MHKTRLLLLFGLGYFFINALVSAQDVQTVDEKKLKKTVKEADRRFVNREMIKAGNLYQSAFNMDQSNFHVAYRLARCKWYSGQLDSAKLYYDHAIKIAPDKNDTIYFDLASALKKQGKYAEAKATFSTFLKRYTGKGMKDFYSRQAEYEIDGCDVAEKLMKKEPEYKYEPTSFNLEQSDFAPALWAVKADSFMVFTSRRAGNRGKKMYNFTGEPFDDLWVVKMENDSTYGEPENLGKKVNTKASDGSAVIDPAGTTMYYTICGRGKFRKVWGCSIYMSEYNGDAKTWSKFRKIEGLNGVRKQVVNSRGKTKEVPTWDGQPCLSEDGSIMYFSSDRDGSVGQTDIWYSTKAGQGWAAPTNCGKAINTEFNESYPLLGKDGKTLYFTSDGHKGLGGKDIWKAEGQQAQWGTPENLGYPINTSYDDFALMWFIQDSIGLISSDRQGTKGRDDIWHIRKIYRPEIKITVHGRVRDSLTKQVIPFATVTLYEVKGNKITPIDTFKTTQNGYYEFVLERNKKYKMVGNAPEYLANEVFVSTMDIKKSTDLEADIDIFLYGIDFDKPIVLQNIYYDFDKADLRPESKSELEKLVKLLTDNPTIVIQIGSHTDTNGSERYNIKLGDRRAKSVVDYLVQVGIPRERLSAFGYGESTPMIYPEMSDSDEQANRRTEFRIKSMDYDPTKTKKDKKKK